MIALTVRVFTAHLILFGKAFKSNNNQEID